MLNMNEKTKSQTRNRRYNEEPNVIFERKMQ